MAISVFQVQSPLTQVTREHTDEYLKTVGNAVGEELIRVTPEEFEKAPFALVYVASGGSEGIFKASFERLCQKPCYILTSGESNSLAASMEILSFLKQQGKRGEILHGSVEDVAKRIRALKLAYAGIEKLKGMRLGVIGAPSDWLIASATDGKAYEEKLGLTLVNIPISELIEETKLGGYEPNKYTEFLMSMGYNKAEMEKSLNIYGALKRIIKKYDLRAVTVRCFDLLDTVYSTGCLGLAILNSEGIYAGCEGDIPAAVSMAILGAVSGQDVFLCNPSRINTAAGEMVLAHCTLPVTMPRNIRLTTHYESNIGVAIAGEIPEGTCTIFKAAGDLSRFFIERGEITENLHESCLCRTQIKLKLDDFSYFLTNPINNHHLVCCGDYTDAVREFFALIG